jgi:hypothetical protein
MLKYLYGLDSVERHRAVAKIVREAITPPATLLDVGGEVSIRCNHLGRFLKGYTITTANVARASDVAYGGDVLPFDDDAFDVVVSLDTAEHVPKEQRGAWIQSFFRVARRKVVLCAPLGTEFQNGVDKQLNELYRELFGNDHHYLSEHIACGMPDIDEVRSWVEGKSHRLYFDGDARVYQKQTETVFRLQKSMGPLKTPLKMLYQLYTSKDLQPLELRDEPESYTRRWYLRVDLDKA